MDNNEAKAKIKKLMALAGNNPSEAEAKRALAKAIELMAEYGIASADDPDPEKVPHKKVCFWRSIGVPQEAQIMAWIVTEFRCSYVPESDNGCGVIVIFGREEDIEVAIEALRLLYATFCATWREYFRTLPKAKQMKRDRLRVDYCLGFVEGFRQYISANNSERGIVLVRSDAIKNAPTVYLYAKWGIVPSNDLPAKPIPERKCKSREVDMAVVNAGYRDGKHVKLQDQLTGG